MPLASPDDNPAWVLDESDAVTDDKAGSSLVPPTATDRELRIVWKMVAVLSTGHIGGLYGAYLLCTQAMWATRAFSTDRELWIVWKMVAVLSTGHIGGLYGAYLLCTQAMWATRAFFVVYYVMGALGITVGAHRFWTHKAFKARLPLQILLMIFNSMIFEGHVYGWARDHRMHHKYSETDADPYNSTRGLFFSHVGWLLVRKHPEIMAKAHTIPMDDLLEDPIVQFQKKYYIPLMIFFAYILPTLIPTLWGESKWTAFFVIGVFRFVYTLNVTFLVNSLAHKWGHRPYDNNIIPVEVKPLSFFVLGEGFHNFHHTFPWDYKAGELGGYSFNISRLFIDAMAKIGMAYDLKSVSRDIVEKRAKRTGDGSHPVWGWDDAAADDKMAAVIKNPDKTE